MIWNEAEIVQKRHNFYAVETASLTFAAMQSVLDPKSKAFSNRVEEITGV